MKQLMKPFSLLLVAGFALLTMGFSLMGPFKTGGPAGSGLDFQGRGFGGRPAGLGYTLAGDIGGPMTPLEGYRWNAPYMTYAFDESFIRYFGQRGVDAVSNAFQILNALPPFTSMSADLSEFPWDSKQAVSYNLQYGTLGLMDIKSLTLAALLEHLGLAKPERFVYGLRGRTTSQFFTNYSTVMLNFDPVTFLPSRYVNGVLYHFEILDAIGPQGGEWASAVEFYQLDPFYLPYSAVAGGLGSSDDEFADSPASFTISGLGPGEYYTGLTRDDIGGLRFLYGTNNLVTELLLTNVTGSLAGNFDSPWQSFFGNTNVFLNGTNTLFSTNSLGTNLIAQGIRPGVNHIQFKNVAFDSLLGQTLIPVTNRWTDTIFTNGRVVIQPVQSASVQPDILFMVQDLGLVFEAPVLFRRSDTSTWQNNDLINGFSTLGGPGVIQPQVQFFFSDQLPYFLSTNPDFVDDLTSFSSAIWSSFDGSTNAPAIFPHFPGTPDLTVPDLVNWVLSTH